MSVIRAQCVLKAVSGLARDNCVNTFHFTGLISDANLLGIRDALERFYTASNAPLGAIDAYLSTAVSHVQVKLYDVTDEPSGPPILVGPEVALDGVRNGTANLPEEAAVCLSFAGAPAAGLDQARRRGRVYLGPLRNAAIEYTVGVGTRVHHDFRDIVLAAGKRLAIEVDAEAEWVVYSRPYAGRGEIVRPGRPTLPAIAARPGTTVNIDQVSCADDVDTQRRRGPRATLRTVVATTA